MGRPGQPLLDIPVTQGRVGLVVPAGLNAMAAVEEAGIETQNVAMASLYEYGDLVSAADLCRELSTHKKPRRPPR